MNTARFESSPTELKVPVAHQPIDAPPHEENDVTLVRNRPAASFAQANDAIDDATPLSRLMLSKERLHVAARNASLPHRQPVKGLQVTVLTSETTFANQVRAALEGVNDVTIVATADEASALAASKRCPILISDTTPTRGAIESLTTQLRSLDPAMVFIVAGKRDLGGMFIGLQSSGAVDGFLLKPATAASTQLVVESATKRYRTANAKSAGAPEPTRRSRTRPLRARGQPQAPAADAIERATPTVEAHVPPPTTSQTITPLATTAPLATQHTKVPRPTWPLMIVAVAIVGAIVWWASSQRPSDIDPRQVIAEQLALAERAHQDGQLIGGSGSAVYHLQTVLTLDPANIAAQRGLERIATQLSRQTQTLMSQQRLADATAALERLREMKPDYAELPLLDAQLKRLQDAVLAAHIAPATSEQNAPPAAEPERKPAIERAETRAVAKPASQSAAERSAVERKQPAPTRVANSTRVSGATAPDVSVSAQAKALPPPSSTVAVPMQQTQPTPAPTAPAQIASNPPAQAPIIPAEPTPAPSESGASEAPTILKYVPPVYPSEAYARNLEGWVQVSLAVTPSGNVVNARIDDGDKRQLFSRAALTAVKQWKYQPRPQASGETPLTVRLDFKLDAR